jgi:hypothetical protein
MHDSEWVGRFYFAPQFTESNWAYRKDMPEVYWLYDERNGTHATDQLGEYWQYMMRDMNPTMTGKKLRTLYDHFRAFTNGKGNGFDTTSEPGSVNYVPLRDYFNNRDLSCSNTMRFDKIRTCGGATHKVIGPIVKIGNCDMYPIDYIRTGGPAPTWAELQPKWWLWFHAVNIHNSSGTPAISDFPQGGGNPVKVPLIAKQQIYIPVGLCQPAVDRADPYRLYMPPVAPA